MSLLMLKSAYEIAREERIRRNNEILRQMEIESLGENVAVAKENKEKKVKTTKKRKTMKPKILPQRRSKRLKGEKADVVDTIVVTAQKPTRRVHHASYSEEQLDKYVEFDFNHLTFFMFQLHHSNDKKMSHIAHSYRKKIKSRMQNRL